MATDYDAPRKSDDESESIEALKERVPTKGASSIDSEDADNPGFELAGADLSDLELDVVVLPLLRGGDQVVRPRVEPATEGEHDVRGHGEEA